MPHLGVDDVRQRMVYYEARVSICRAAGGISREEVLDNVATVPDGWVEDVATCYWIPPNLHLPPYRAQPGTLV